MTVNKTVKEPLFHIVKRPGIPVWKRLVFYTVAIVVALLIAGVFCSISSGGHSIFEFFDDLFDGVFGTERRIWIFLRDGALLLGVSLALLPAFKMKFWNLGANGQIVIASLVAYACMFYFKDSTASNFWITVLMIVLSVFVGVLWAVIPAIFKAIFKTNETLFTLMMNYIAQGLVTVMITVWAPTGSGSLDPINNYGVSSEGFTSHILTLIVIGVITVFMFFYLTRSKHGYELALVGESENSALYAGINIKKVVIRTLILSGAICGIIGFMLAGCINHTVHSTMHSNMGFTAVITSWLAQFNPLVVIGTSYLLTFISRGMSNVRSEFGFYNDALANVVVGFIYFFIIGCDFFIRYKLVFRKKNGDEEMLVDFMNRNQSEKVEKSEEGGKTK